MRGTLTGQRYVDDILRPHVGPFLNVLPETIFQQDNARPHAAKVAQDFLRHFQTFPWPARSPFCPLQSTTATAGSDVVQSGRPIFDDFFQHLWPYIGNNTANAVFQMVKRLWLIGIDQWLYIAPQKIV
ncbi:DDE_3 domain-containing protein [Trichonephila clavipes]|nr:DDE_3 domain-containing protein [Trichonephila clavipes]